MVNYINIHTHHLPNDNSNSIVNNRYGYDKKIYCDSLFSVGIHPWDVDLIDQSLIKNFENSIIHKNCFAIGECGLDKLKNPNLTLQKSLFELQLNLAVKYHKPVIIHCVKAFDEMIEICAPFQKKIPLIIHGFNKSSQLASQLINHGFYISLNFEIINKTNFVFEDISIEKLFFETDINQNITIEEIYVRFSKEYKIDLNELKKRINLNFEGLII